VHPGIVRVFDYDVQDGVPFLVIDYAPNGTLRHRYPKGNLFPLPVIISSVKQVADALQYAHEQKFIHRDVKPEYMLLGRRQEVLLSDFGIATIAHSTSSLGVGAEGASGTLAYMAPEQIEGHARAASDQYALGIVVYEWLCGERPFEGSVSELIAQQLSVSPLPLHERMPSIPAEVEQVVLRALAKDPKARFASVADFARALEQASQHAIAPTGQLGSSQPVLGSAAATSYETVADASGHPVLPTETTPSADLPVGELEPTIYPDSSPPRGGTWTIGSTYQPVSLIDRNAQQSVSEEIDEALYLPLFYSDAFGVIHPGAASVVPTVHNGGINADATIWTFHLRPGLVWSDEQAYDARDVDFTWPARACPTWTGWCSASSRRTLSTRLCRQAPSIQRRGDRWMLHNCRACARPSRWPSNFRPSSRTKIRWTVTAG
jgi:serine/threonine protein kinase